MAAKKRASTRGEGGSVSGQPGAKLPGWPWLGALALAAVVVWIYRPAIHGAFVWDDDELITNNAIVHDPAGLWTIWFTPWRMIDFQPITVTVVWLECHLWGGNTLGFHALNLVLHTLNALLIWRLLARLGLRYGWLGGLLFAVHPTAVESVAWISELKNTLSMPPFLLAAMFYVDFVERGRRGDYLAALGLFVVAMLCKATMSMFPVVILLYVWWRRGKLTARDGAASAPFFAVSLLIGAITVWFIDNNGGAKAVALPDFGSRVVCSGLALAFYAGKVIWPVGLLPTYPRWTIDPSSLPELLPWPILFAALFWFWTQRAGWGRHALLGVGFFVVNLLPFLGLKSASFMYYTWVTDHVLYIPIIGPIALAVAAIETVDKRLPAAIGSGLIGVVGLAVVAMAVESHGYAGLFRDARSLWSYTLARNPDSVPAHTNIARVLEGDGKIFEAISRYRQALALDPKLGVVHYDLGSDLHAVGEDDEAIKELRRAVELAPELTSARLNLGTILQDEGHADEAESYFEKAVQLAPESSFAHQKLGENRRLLGRLKEAQQDCELAVKFDPANPDARFNLGAVEMEQLRIPEALKECGEALRLRPDFPDCFSLRGAIEFYQGDDEAALADFTRAIQGKPGLTDALFRRAVLLEARGDLESARADDEEASRVTPNHPLADYARLFIWVIEAKEKEQSQGDRDLTTALAETWNAKADGWETELARFLLGEVKDQTLLDEAKADSANLLSRECDAWYFVGIKRELAGDRAGAIKALQQAVATHETDSICDKLAVAEWKELGGK